MTDKRKYKNPQVNLRLPEELKEKVSRIAEIKKRSANAEMVAAIEHWVNEHDVSESNKVALDFVKASHNIKAGNPVGDLLDDFVEKVTPLLIEEIKKMDLK